MPSVPQQHRQRHRPHQSQPKASSARMYLLLLLPSIARAEFPMNGNDASVSCTLNCQNGGVCKTHVTVNSSMTTDGILPSWWNGWNTQNLSSTTITPYCDCSQVSYLGEYCTIPVTRCSSSSVVCLAGEVCVQDDNGNDFCQCNPSATTADGIVPCQQHQRVICRVPGQPPGTSSFCVNGGACNNNGNCVCPYGFGGPHCEFITTLYAGGGTGGSASEVSTNDGGNNRANVAFASVFSVVLVVLIFIIGMLLRKSYRRRRERIAMEQHVVTRTLMSNNDSPTNMSGPFDPEPQKIVLDMGPNHDFDGNELEEVDII